MSLSPFSNLTVALLACAALVAGPASAADTDVPPADANYDWEGFYAGMAVGAAGSGIDFAGVGRKNKLDIEDNFTSYAGIAGYNMMAGNFVFGAEASLGNGGFDKQQAITGLGTVTEKSDFLGTLQLRGGYAFDELMIYGTAGLAMTDLEISSSLGGKQDKTLWGAVAGVGAEYALSDNILLRAEALAYGFETDPVLAGSKRKFNFGDATARIGMTFKF